MHEDILKYLVFPHENKRKTTTTAATTKTKTCKPGRKQLTWFPSDTNLLEPRTASYRPFPRPRQEFGTSIAPCRVGRLAAVQQRRAHGHFTRRTFIFRFKSMVEKKMDSWSRAQRQNLSVVIYHTLFSHNEERFHQTGFKREKIA